MQRNGFSCSALRFFYFLKTALYCDYRAVISFFMFFMISFTAVKTTVNVSNKITSVIKTLTPFHKGAETTAAVSLRNYTTNVAVVATN